MQKRAIFLVAVSAICAFAEKDYDEAIEPFQNSPGSVLTEAAWIEPHDETYLPYNACSEVQGLDFVKLEEQVKYYYDHKDGWTDFRHYHALVSIVRVTYRVTCLNKLQYEGVHHLFSEPRKIDGSSLQNSDVVKRFKAHAHGWEERPLDYLGTDGVYRAKETEYRFEDYTVLDWAKLKETWKEQKVAYPEWQYTGIPGKKLPRPVLFVHGLNDDYESWGVEASVDKGKGKNKGLLEFQNGLVKKYENGSAPDILARSQNIDNSEENINHNGIYFFQSPGKWTGEAWNDALPHWNAADAEISQSRKLYKKLEEVLDDFCEGTGIDWRKTPELEVDIVAHSQGGLVVREMLRGLGDDAASFPNGEANPANHIGKLVTIDTPHLGAATAADNSTAIRDYLGLGMLIDDLEAYASGKARKHRLVNASVSLDFSNPLSFLLVDMATSILGYVGFFATTAEYSVRMSGPYLGPYKFTFNVDLLGPWDFDISDPKMRMDALKDYRDMALTTRKKGNHLSSESEWMKGLNFGKDGESYPKLPNGDRLVILPMYSEDVSPVVAGLLMEISENLKILCTEEESDKGKEACVALESYLENWANEFLAKYTLGTVGGELEISDSLLVVLNSLQEDWLSNSDLIVEATSQRYESQEIDIAYNLISELKKPRPYLFHDALAPWETVLHMGGRSLAKKIPVASAALQGQDIACALDFYCDSLLQGKMGAEVMYLENGSVSLSGDFEVAPLFLNRNAQALKISDGASGLVASYKPGKGSVVTLAGENGEVREHILVSEKVATSPRLKREGDSVTVAFANYSGKVYSKKFEMAKLSDQVVLSVLAEEGESVPKAIVGVGTPSDTDSQKKPEIPAGTPLSGRKIFAMHREAREVSEKNTSRPRILVANSTGEDVGGFRVAYYFTADPARNPQVEVDYPRIPVTLEHLGGDQWRFVLDAGDSVLKAKSVFPNMDGWQIRIHYGDWADYVYSDDYSADYSVGIPLVNSRIVVYAKDGEILWGKEPTAFSSEGEHLVETAKATLSYEDSAPWESNYFKPRFTVQNTGGVALKNYQAKLWFRVPEGKTLFVPVADWYTPVSTPSLEKVDGSVWALNLYFDKYILYPGESVAEGNVGLHLEDWSAFDKTVCGVALFDAESNLIYGSIPTVEECKAYGGLKSAQAQFAWRR